MTKSPKLLVVDDDPGIRTELKWGFDGYEVYTADDREHALEQFNKYHPPVVTLDLGLPPDKDGVTEGYQILNKILEVDPETKVIVVSGSEEESNRLRAVKSGAFEFYPKPINIEKLSEIVARAMLDYESDH